MKHCAAVLCGLICLFSGCAVSKTVPVTDGFTSQVTLAYDDQVYEGVLTCRDADNAQLVISSPDTVAGLTFLLESGQVTMSYSGVSLSVSDQSLPVGAAIKLLSRALSAVAQEETLSSPIVNGEEDGVAYELVFQEETGFPLSLTVSSIPLHVTFFDWETIAL